MVSRQRLRVQDLSAMTGGPNVTLNTVSAGMELLSTGGLYDLHFILKHPQAPYIKIDTEQRVYYLGRGTEEMAEAELVTTALAIRQITGGRFNIHPFEGAVWGTAEPKILNYSPDEGLGPGYYGNLTMIIFLHDEVRFNPAITKLREGLGTMYLVTPATSRIMGQISEMQNKLANFNQENRDQAYMNGLGRQFDAEYVKFNQDIENGGVRSLLRRNERIPGAMGVTPDNIAKALRIFESRLGLRVRWLEVSTEVRPPDNNIA